MTKEKKEKKRDILRDLIVGKQKVQPFGNEAKRKRGCVRRREQK